VPKKQPASDLVADLTWAQLYTAEIREGLKIVTPGVKRLPSGPELRESAALLRRQLESANRTIAKLRILVRSTVGSAGESPGGVNTRGGQTTNLPGTPSRNRLRV
jgi:hypothetical protein